LFGTGAQGVAATIGMASYDAGKDDEKANFDCA